MLIHLRVNRRWVDVFIEARQGCCPIQYARAYCRASQKVAILPCYNEYINPPLIDPQMNEHVDKLFDKLLQQVSNYDDIYERASINLMRA